MPEQTKKIAKFRIVSAKIEQFASFEENYSAKDCTIDIKSSIKYTYEVPSHKLECSCTVNCFEENKIVVKAGMAVGYELSDETIADLTRDGRIVIPKELLGYFGSNAYGALRGMLVAKLEQTPIRILLPLDSIGNMIEQPLVVEV